MAIEGVRNLTALNVRQLYAVYTAVARADFSWRLKAMYGDKTPPTGHAEFRPLPYGLFEQRFVAAGKIVGGQAVLSQRLARQAAAYKVDIDAAISRRNQAA